MTKYISYDQKEENDIWNNLYINHFQKFVSG